MASANGEGLAERGAAPGASPPGPLSTGVVAVAGGLDHSVALGANGAVWTFGRNSSGQLGTGTTARSLVPVAVPGLGPMTAIAAGSVHTLAVATTRQVTTAYGYDRLYRLTGGGTPGVSNAYTYDPVGNRLSLTQGSGAPTAYTYDKADRLLTVGGNAYAVDADGDLTAYPGAALAYDQANRLETATIGSTGATYGYDGDGKRASKTVRTATTSYSYDANRPLPVVLTDGTLKYVWGNGLAYAADTSGTVQDVYHADGPGSVHAIAEAEGAADRI